MCIFFIFIHNFLTTIDPNATSLFGYVDLKLNKHKLMNTYSKIYNIASIGTSISGPEQIEPILLTEQYILNTYAENKINSYGQLSWSVNYITGSSIYSTVS